VFRYNNNKSLYSVGINEKKVLYQIGWNGMADLPPVIFEMVGCRCKRKDLIVKAHGAYYPCMGMFKEGRRFLNIKSNGFCWHFWNSMVTIPDCFSSRSLVLIRETRAYVLCLQVQHAAGVVYGISAVAESTFMGVRPNIHVWRVQRAVRRFIMRLNERRQAIAMALHSRLGMKSILSSLPDDLVKRLACDFSIASV
jgi:hypothetical protein